MIEHYMIPYPQTSNLWIEFLADDNSTVEELKIKLEVEDHSAGSFFMLDLLSNLPKEIAELMEPLAKLEALHYLMMKRKAET